MKIVLFTKKFLSHLMMYMSPPSIMLSTYLQCLLGSILVALWCSTCLSLQLLTCLPAHGNDCYPQSLILSIWNQRMTQNVLFMFGFQGGTLKMLGKQVSDYMYND